MKVTTYERKYSDISPKEMKVGDIGIIVSADYNSQIVLRGYNILISLSDPNHHWLDLDRNTLLVRVFAPGSVITLTQE